MCYPNKVSCVSTYARTYSWRFPSRCIVDLLKINLLTVLHGCITFPPWWGQFVIFHLIYDNMFRPVFMVIIRSVYCLKILNLLNYILTWFVYAVRSRCVLHSCSKISELKFNRYMTKCHSNTLYKITTVLSPGVLLYSLSIHFRVLLCGYYCLLLYCPLVYSGVRLFVKVSLLFVCPLLWVFLF
jgi:hypothetical protein